MIRKVKKDEILECVQIIKQSFATVALEFGITVTNAPNYVAFSTTEAKLLKQLYENRTMVAYYDANDNILGYYSLHTNEKNECEMNNLCVVPFYRHNNIGTDLVEDAFERARSLGCTTMYIGIIEENKILKDWYTQLGFVHIGTKKIPNFPFICGYMKKAL